MENIVTTSVFDFCYLQLSVCRVLLASVIWVSSYLGKNFQVTRVFSQDSDNPVIRVIRVIRVTGVIWRYWENCGVLAR